MNLNLKNKFFTIILIIIATCVGYYAGATYTPLSQHRMNISENKQTTQNDASKLLEELNAVMSNPHATVDTINNFLIEKFGPCWGIRDGQCRE